MHIGVDTIIEEISREIVNGNIRKTLIDFRDEEMKLWISFIHIGSIS
jgi:hypothetical protein